MILLFGQICLLIVRMIGCFILRKAGYFTFIKVRKKTKRMSTEEVNGESNRDMKYPLIRSKVRALSWSLSGSGHWKVYEEEGDKTRQDKVRDMAKNKYLVINLLTGTSSVSAVILLFLLLMNCQRLHFHIFGFLIFDFCV